MNDDPLNGPLPPPLEAEPAEPALALRKIGWPWLAWPVILLAVVAAIFLRSYASQVEAEAAVQGTERNSLEAALARMQGRYVVGAAQLTGQRDERLLEQVRTFNSGSAMQQLRHVILAGELVGPAEALQHLDALKKKLSAQKSPEAAALAGILRRLYGDYTHFRLEAPSVSKAERADLVRELDWFGELALAPAGSRLPPEELPAAVGAAGAVALARAGPPNRELREEVLSGASRTFLTTFLAILGAGGLSVVGLVGLVLFVTAALAGMLRGGLECGSGRGGVYAETFALWMIVFFLLSAAASLVPLPVPLFLRTAASMFLSLGVLAWPVLRGVSWTQVRQDLGWTLGRHPALEPAIGAGCWVMSLPLLGLALLFVLGWLLLQRSLGEGGEGGDAFSPINRAAHPIVRYLAEGGWWERLQILLLASVAAPVVEETMFRGVLYRHLREASCRMRFLLSVLFSATVTNFIFAVIHPQGLLGVPLLMALAYGFTLAREWRGTLIPAMVGHGLSNGLVMLVSILALAD